MLAYELFHNNKNSTVRDVKDIFPTKKIFYKKNDIVIDPKTLDEYDPKTITRTEQLQKWLQMPLNTTDAKLLNLPDFRTGSASQNPYIEVYGNLKTNNKQESKLTLLIGKKSNGIEYVLDLTSNEVKFNDAKEIILKLNKKEYFMNSNELFNEYVKSGIIDEFGVLNIFAYHNIIQKFLKFIKEQKSNITKIGNIPFRIYILPDATEITYIKQSKKDDSHQISSDDYFNNTVLGYSSAPTKTANFLSFHDASFTVNCMQGEDFYKNLGIGRESLEKIYADPSQTFRINHLNWTFLDMDKSVKFNETKNGLLAQLYENYTTLKNNDSDNYGDFKIICIQHNREKQELLINETISVNQLEKIFLNIKNIHNIPEFCFEILLYKSDQKLIWDVYIRTIQNFITGQKTSKNYLLSFFTKILKEKRCDWIKLKNKSKQWSFFNKSNFCLQCLCGDDNQINYMDKNEEFAEKVGQIVRLCVDSKKDDEYDYLSSDILMCSKYDREKLRFIISRICRDLSLSKFSNDGTHDVMTKIRLLQLEKEIEDTAATKDYSYFFFKGFYFN